MKQKQKLKVFGEGESGKDKSKVLHEQIFESQEGHGAVVVEEPPSGVQLFNNTQQRRRRQKKNREISMSDIMPKFDNTLQMKLEASGILR